MPLTALRLVNKPGTRRRKPFPAYSRAGAKKTKRRNPVAQARPVLKRVKMGNSYRWSYGGKLIPNAKGTAMDKRRRATKAAARSLTGTKPRTNPTKKRKTATKRRRNPWVSAGRSGGSVWVEPRKGSRKQTGSRMWSAAKSRRKKAATKKRRPTTARKRTGSKLSAAHRRKISLALKRYHRSTTRVSSPPKKRRKTVARKKTARRRVSTRRRTTTSRRRPRPGTKAWMSYIGKKGAAARRRGKKRTSTKRRRVRRNPSTYKVGRPRRSKQRIMLRTKPYGPRRAHRVTQRRYTHKRTRRPHYRNRLSVVKRNPGLGDIGALVKKVLPIYGGMIAARVITGVVDKNVIQQYLVGAGKPIAPENAAYAKMMAPGLTFLLSVFLGPSVLKGPTGGKLLEGLQLGSLVTTFDTILSAVLPVNAKAYIGLTGYDDMGVLGYGRAFGAYMADPTGYSLPRAHATMEPGIGLDVHEAMALDSYVADDGMGLSVEEALADSESDYMQRGGAGGSLAKTVFTY